MRRPLALIALAVLAPTAAPAQQTPPAPPAAPGEVVVTAKTPPVQTAIDRRSYSVAGDLQAQTGSIADALRNLPSVEVDVQGNVSLRGDPNVTILIDGKPSSLFQGDNKAQALQQISADSIDRVEVMTNPSAEFRTDGTAGIINLITKKARGPGQTASARLLAGNAGRVVASASTGYRDGKLGLSSDLGYRHDTQRQDIGEARGQPDPAGGTDQTDQQQRVHIQLGSTSDRNSVDYDLDARTRLSGEFRANVVDFRLDSLTHFTTDKPSDAQSGAFDRALDIHQKRSFGQLGATLRRELDAGAQLVLSLTYNATNDARIRSGHTLDQLPPAPDAFDQQRLNYDLGQTELKGDYVRPTSGAAVLKLGFDFEFDDNAYRNRGFAGASPGALAPDAGLTNLFVFKQTLSQAYATYERPIGAVRVLAGLRVEDVQLNLDQASLGQTVEQNYLRAYPTLHLDWKLSDQSHLTASYSHRVQRPDPSEFNPFRFLLDPVTFRAGNPNLKPQQTQSFELGYEYRNAPVLLLATLYYRQNRDGVADVLHDLGDGIFLTERDNVTRSRSGGLELVANAQLTKTLSYNLSSNLFWNAIDANGPTFAPARSLFTGSGRANLNWQATPSDLVQLNGVANGKRLTAQGYAKPTAFANLGYRHKLDNQWAFLLTAQDLFGSLRDRQRIDTPALSSHYSRSTDSRLFLAGFVWTFGGGRSRDAGFDFQAGSGAAGPP